MLEDLGICTQAAFGNRVLLSPDHIRDLVSTGIGWIEIGGPNGMCFNYDDEQYIDRIAQAVHEPDDRAWSMHGPFCPVSMDDRETREQAIASLVRAGKIAARFGVGRLVMHPGRDVPTVDRRREIEWCREGIARALESIRDE